MEAGFEQSPTGSGELLISRWLLATWRHWLPRPGGDKVLAAVSQALVNQERGEGISTENQTEKSKHVDVGGLFCLRESRRRSRIKR